MHYSLLVPYQVVRTISPSQYNRLRANGNKAQGNQYVKTVMTDYATYLIERPKARRYVHADYHAKYPNLPCHYDGCDREVK